MNYLVGGTWREARAQGIFLPFAVEVEAQTEEEARNIVHDYKGPFGSKYDDILIKTVIGNYHPKSKDQRDWHIRAQMGEAEVHLMIVDLDWFLQSKGTDIIFACNVVNQQFTIEKNQLSNFYQL